MIAEVVGDLPRSPLAKVLGVGLAKNSGVRRGVVRDIEETVRSVTAALRDAERMSGVKAAAVTCGIAGEHVSARNSSGVVAVNGDEITPADVARVNEVARAVSLGPDQELLHDIPQEYMVDQQRGISDPVGMTGMRLEVEAYLVTVQSTAAQNLRKAVQRAGYRVADLVLEPLAASYAVLTDDEKELGVALVEVGGGSTGVAIFHEGKIRHVASLKYAGAHVTNDLVQGLGVTQADAELDQWGTMRPAALPVGWIQKPVVALSPTLPDVTSSRELRAEKIWGRNSSMSVPRRARVILVFFSC